MNAVKRCLALIAATLVVGACGGDPTAGDAGADLTIRATPGAVWVRNGTSATVNIEAIDKLGAPVEGHWTVGTIVGPFTAAIDTAFQNTSVGQLNVKARFVITPTAEGEGSVKFTGTGGTDSVPVRSAPDTSAFAVTANDSTPSLFQPITLTAPAGIVFTGATTVRFYSGPLPLDTANGGLSFPTIISRSADSTQITFVPGPGAHGFARITAVASRSTPGLTTTARTAFQFGLVPTQDTTGLLFDTDPHFATQSAAVGAARRVSASFFDTLVVTAPANYVFLPSTTIEFFRLVAANATTANPDGYTVANGTTAPIKVSLSADSSTMKWLVAPGLRGRIRIKNLAFRVAPAINFATKDNNANLFDQRSGIAGAPDTSAVAWTFSKVSPIAEGDSVTATAPAGWVFVSGTASVNAGSASAPSGGDSARVVLYSADSSKVTFGLAPGASGKFRYGNMARRDRPSMQWQARGGAISAAAAPAVVATLTPGTANMNDTVVVALDPAGPYRFRPSSTGILGGFAGMVAKVSTDSLSMKVLPPPGLTGPMTLTNIKYANLPTYQVVAATAASVTINAATSLGADDPKAGAIAVVAAPTAAGQIVGFWDQATMGADDYTGDGGVAAQYIRITAAANRTVNFKVDWSQGTAASTDIDFILVDDDGSFDSFVGGVTTGAASGKPENATYALVAGHSYVLAIIDFAGNIVSTTGVKVTMVGQ
jgi:hypothetical protein